MGRLFSLSRMDVELDEAWGWWAQLPSGQLWEGLLATGGGFH